MVDEEIGLRDGKYLVVLPWQWELLCDFPGLRALLGNWTSLNSCSTLPRLHAVMIDKNLINILYIIVN
jgi:hypothetical protein